MTWLAIPAYFLVSLGIYVALCYFCGQSDADATGHMVLLWPVGLFVLPLVIGSWLFNYLGTRAALAGEAHRDYRDRRAKAIADAIQELDKELAT